MSIDPSIIRVQRLCGSHSLATSDQVLAYINDRHRSLLESFDWYRKKTEISVTARTDKTTGTVQVANNSPTVIGTGTAWTASDVGRYMTIGDDQDSLYVVKSVPLATQLTLGDLMGTTVNYPGTSASGLNYVMFSRIYSLGPGIADVISVKHQTPMTQVTEEYLDDLDPSRTGLAQYANCWAKAPVGANDVFRIEFYPRPSQAMVITVRVLRKHVDLLPSQDPIVPATILEYGAAADMCLTLHARTKEPKWVTLAHEYDGLFERVLEREKNTDASKFGVQQQVRDVNDGTNLSFSDFALDHDV